MDGLSRQRSRQALTVAKCPAPSGGLCPDSPSSSDFGNLRTNFIPSHDTAAFGSPRPPQTRRRVVPVLPSRRLPAFIGRNFITTTESSATSHRIVWPRVSPCAALFRKPTAGSRNDTRLPQLPRVPCELPHPQSRSGSDQVSGFALFCTLTHPPRRIRFACAMCSSLPIASFRPAIAGHALAIRIVFPLVGVTPVSSNRPGLPATLGKQNERRTESGPPFLHGRLGSWEALSPRLSAVPPSSCDSSRTMRGQPSLLLARFNLSLPRRQGIRPVRCRRP